MHLGREILEGEDGIADEIFGRVHLGGVRDARKIGVRNELSHDAFKHLVEVLIIVIELLARDARPHGEFAHCPVIDAAL